MAINIFKSLFHEKVNTFSKLYSETSKNIFYDDEKHKLIHPGEFGTYRESICKDFIKFFVPMQFEIDNGFIINANNEISTQCDLFI